MRKLKKVLSIILTAVLILSIAGIRPVEARAASDITGSNYIWDDWRFALTIDSSNPYDDTHNILVPGEYWLTIDKAFSFSGEMTINANANVTIGENGSITGGTINPSHMARITFAKPSSATGFTLYAAGGESSFDNSKINMTEFQYETDKWVEVIPECGLMLSSDNTISHGSVSYKLKKGTEVIKSGNLTGDWEVGKILFSEEEKLATEVEFHVVADTANGYTINSNGIRCGVVNNVISDDDDIKDGEATCSYFFDNGVDRLYTVEVEFVKLEDLATTAEFSWTRDDRVLNADWEHDRYVSNGNIRIYSATKDDSPVESSGNIENPPYYSSSMEKFEEGTDKEFEAYVARFEVGTKVVVEIVPDRGYQLTRFTLSGIESNTTPMGETNTYEFEITRPVTFHLGAVFTRTPDEVDTDRASGVSGGSISTISAGDVDAGTVALNVEDVTPDSAEQSKFEEMASEGGYTVDQTLSIGVEQRFYKGVENATRDQCWVQPISQTLTDDADIKLNISGITGSEVEVLHNHGGSYEIIPATYSNGVLSFKTKSFSDFAIVSKGAKPAPSTSSSSSSSDSKSEEEVAPVVAKPTTLGTVVGGTTVRNWDDLEKVMTTKSVATAKTKAEKTAAKAPLVLVLNQRNATVPVSTIQALQKSDASSLHLMLGNGAAITISNGAGLKNQGAINLTNKVTQTKNSKTITFNANTKLLTLGALHMSVPKNVTEAKLYYVLNRQSVYLGTFKPVNGQVFFPINQLGTYQLVY